MSGFGLLSLIAGALQLTVPSYALRLVRLFGTRHVGWFLVAAFSSLALVHLLQPLVTFGTGPASGMSLELVCALASLLLLIGMGHMEILLSQRQQAQREEQHRRSEWERQASEQTASLAQTNQALLQGLSAQQQELKALQASEAQYRLLFLEHPQPMWIFDLRSLRFLAVNHAALRHYGFTTQEFLSLSARELLPAEVAPAFLQDVAKPCAAVACRGLWPIYKKNRTLVDVEITALDLKYDGCPARLILAEDVSLRQQHESDSLAAQKRKVIKQVAGGVAHHFNDLLTTINSQINAVLQQPLDPRVPEQLKRISAAANRAAGLNRQLLIIGGGHPINKELLDVNSHLERLTPMLRRLIGEQIVLQKAAGSHLPPVLADLHLVEHILVHLVLNARQAMPSGGTLTLSTSCIRIEESQVPPHSAARPGPFVRLSVRDTGCGMTAETQARLFEPFFTTRQTGQGIGLGLASLYGAIENLSGWIEFTSSPQAGTEFRVFFPCASLPATSTALSAPLARPSSSGETILLVQAEERARGLARHLLGRQGYRVIEVDGASTALALWESQASNVDLLLTDLVLPGDISGTDLASRLRQAKPHLKVLFCSDITAGQHLTPVASDHIVSTPFTSGNLLKAVHDCLARDS